MLLLLLCCVPATDSASNPVSDSAPSAPAPNLSATYGIDFGQITVGTSRFQEITTGNVGEMPLQIGDIVAPKTAAFTASAIGSILIAPGQSTTLTVTFTPPAVGVVEDELGIESDDPHEPIHWIHLTGEGI